MRILRYYVCVYAYMRVFRFDYIVMERLRCIYIRYYYCYYYYTIIGYLVFGTYRKMCRSQTTAATAKFAENSHRIAARDQPQYSYGTPYIQYT